MLVHRARSECVLIGEGARPRVKRLSDRRGVRWVNKCLGRAGETEIARSLNQPALAP